MPEFGKISPESVFFHWILENFGRNLGFFAGFWNFWPESGNLSIGSDFSGFKGGKPKPNPPESVFGDEDPPPIRRSSRVGWFQVGSS